MRAHGRDLAQKLFLTAYGPLQVQILYRTGKYENVLLPTQVQELLSPFDNSVFPHPLSFYFQKQLFLALFHQFK